MNIQLAVLRFLMSPRGSGSTTDLIGALQSLHIKNTCIQVSIQSPAWGGHGRQQPA